MLSDKLREAGCEVNGDGNFVVKVASETYGNEYYCALSEVSALESLTKLYQAAAGKYGYESDHVDREVSMVIGWPLDLDYLSEEGEDGEGE